MSIIERFLKLDLPAGKCVVIGSGILDALGLRKSDDIDLAVSPELFSQLQVMDGWVSEEKHGEIFLLKDDVEVWQDWGTDEESSFSNLYKNSVVIQGVHFANPQFVLGWKKQRNREKDVKDIQLLEEYLNRG
jgi:hypothetical protein